MSTEASTWVRGVGAGAVGVVAAVAAVVSYVHMHDLAEQAGEGWRAWLEPFSVDGLLVGSSLVLLTRRHAGWLAWLSLAIGLSVSLAANLASAQPGLVPHLVAAWPALALALSYETLLSLLRPAGEQRKPAGQPWWRRRGDRLSPADDLTLADQSGEVVAERPPALVAVTSEEAPPGLASWPVATVTRLKKPANLADLEARARRLIAQGRQEGRQVGRNTLAKELGVSAHRARQLLDTLDDDESEAVDQWLSS